MTIYLPKLGAGTGQPFTNTSSSGTWESVKEGFSQGLREGPMNSVLRSDEIDDLINDPNSLVIPKEDADKRLLDAGVRNITIPQNGVSQSYLDHVLKENVNRLKSQAILSTNGGGMFTSGAVFLSQLAGDMADPGNLAIAFVPYAGQAATASRWARAGGRFVQGAKIGGAQALVTSPLTAMANTAEGQEYSNADIAMNVAFGAIAGGGMNALGGFIGDVIKGPRTAHAALSDTNGQLAAGGESMGQRLGADIASGLDAELPRFDLETSVARNADNYAYKVAYEDILSQVSDVVGIDPSTYRGQRTLDSVMGDIDNSLKRRIREYQDQRMSYKEAKVQALNDIQTAKREAQVNYDEINRVNELLGGHKADDLLSKLQRGHLPEHIKTLIDGRAQEVLGRLQKSPLAKSVSASQRIDAAPWPVRQQSIRAAIAQAMDGKRPDVEPFYDLTNPALQKSALQRIANYDGVSVDETALRASRHALDNFNRSSRADLDNVVEDFNFEIDKIRNRMSEGNTEMEEIIGAISREANDTSYIDGLRAFAGCMLRRL